jgi:hypothetical protein
LITSQAVAYIDSTLAMVGISSMPVGIHFTVGNQSFKTFADQCQKTPYLGTVVEM